MGCAVADDQNTKVRNIRNIWDWSFERLLNISRKFSDAIFVIWNLIKGGYEN